MREYPATQEAATETDTGQVAAPVAVQRVHTVPVPIKEYPLLQVVATVADEQAVVPVAQAVQAPAEDGPKNPLAQVVAVVAVAQELAPTPQLVQAPLANQ